MCNHLKVCVPHEALVLLVELRHSTVLIAHLLHRITHVDVPYVPCHSVAMTRVHHGACPALRQTLTEISHVQCIVAAVCTHQDVVQRILETKQVC